SDEQVNALVRGLLDAGVTYFDTAPAYGVSEERLGRALSPRPAQVVISTKVGEVFENGVSEYRFDAAHVRASVATRAARLGAPRDIVLIHAPADDVAVLAESEAVASLVALRAEGLIRAIGLSGKTPRAAELALDWADAIMIEYHSRDRSHEDVIAAARRADVGVIVKKGLASGELPADEAIRFVLSNPDVDSLVIGGLSLEHFAANAEVAAEVAQSKRC
ncbi:MAG: aldo/keto reductase, partial [Phycisphaerales bacterium]|nr:aldo/keto reductase [Phycisphaerales bacterium]